MIVYHTLFASYRRAEYSMSYQENGSCTCSWSILKDERRTSNVQLRTSNKVCARFYYCLKSCFAESTNDRELVYQTTKRSDRLIRRWTLDVRCWTFLFPFNCMCEYCCWDILKLGLDTDFNIVLVSMILVCRKIYSILAPAPSLGRGC